MKKNKLQTLVIILGLIAIGLGVKSLLQIPTMILPTWFLVLLYLPFVLLISFTLGFITKKLTKSTWHTLTLSTILAAIISLTFYFSEYKPSYTVKIPDTFVGEVKLFVTNESTNDLNVNKLGVGYINQKTYKNGFQPTILKGDKDITKEIHGYSTGTFASSLLPNKQINYISFLIPGKKESEDDENNFDELIKSNRIDTARILRE